MRPKDFQHDFASFEQADQQREVNELNETRCSNAEAALRIGRHVRGYDRTGYWPHKHEPHDELVEPMYLAKFAGTGVGVVFAKMVTELYIADPSIVVQVVTIAGFLGLSQAAESTFCAWRPIPLRFESGARSVVACGVVAAVPVVTWLLMRLPGTPLAPFAENWEGVALAGAECTLLLFSAAAGAAGRAYRWSRDYFKREVGLRDRLIELGAEVAGIPADLRSAEAESILTQ